MGSVVLPTTNKLQAILYFAFDKEVNENVRLGSEEESENLEGIGELVGALARSFGNYRVSRQFLDEGLPQRIRQVVRFPIHDYWVGVAAAAIRESVKEESKPREVVGDPSKQWSFTRVQKKAKGSSAVSETPKSKKIVMKPLEPGRAHFVAGSRSFSTANFEDLDDRKKDD